MRRVLWLVSTIVLVDVLFYSSITPLLPAYVDDLDLTKGQAGMLTGAYALGTLGASLPAGWVAARIGAKRTLLAALVLLAFACVAFGVGERYEVLVAARLLQGLAGAGAWVGGLSWLVSAAPRERRGHLIGAALGWAIAGAIGGPVLGALAGALSTEAVFPAVGALCLVLAGVVASTAVADRDVPSGDLRGALRTPRILAGAWLTTLPALFFGTFSVLAPLRLDELGAGAAAVAAVFLLAALVEACTTPLVGRLSDRRGRLLPLRAGLVGVVVMGLVLPLPGAAVLLGAGVVVSAALAGVMWAPAMALLSDGAEAIGLSQGVAFALLNLAWAGGQLGGSAGGGTLAEATADAVPYVVVAALATVTLALVLLRGPVRVGAAHGTSGGRP